MLEKNIISKEEFIESLKNECARVQGQHPMGNYILTPAEEAQAGERYDHVLEMLNWYVPQDAETNPNSKISVALYGFSNGFGGMQIISEGNVSDRGRPMTDQVNWYLQNTSQWLFAFGLVFDARDRHFSIHT